MPEISRFYGIIIKMFFKPKEHEPSHIHALYGEYVRLLYIYLNFGWKRYAYRPGHPLDAAAAGCLTRYSATHFRSAPTRRWVALPYGVPLPPALYTCKNVK